MPSQVLRRVIPVLAVMFISACGMGCDKTAEDTNKPVMIQGFTFTVDGEDSTPSETLQIEPGAVLTIKVQYVDPDGGDEPNPAWYSFMWAVERINAGVSPFNPNTFFIVQDENPCIWTAPTVTGFYRFRVEVRDKYQTPSMESVVVEVNANKRPIINELTISDANPFVNQEITITVDATDPDGNLPLEYDWQATGGYFTSESEGEAKWLSPTSGEFTITVIITDQVGGSVSRELPVIVQENHAPVILGWELEPGNSVKINELVTITLSAEDADGDDLEYNWSADYGTFNSVNQNVAVWRAPDTATSCTVTCVVEDNRGKSDTADIVINVTE